MINKTLPVSHALLHRIAREVGTPVYVYDEQTILRRCSELTQSLPHLPVSWMYAMKANDNPFLIQLIHAAGFGFDAVSPEEIELALRLGAEPEKIFYTESNMSDGEMLYAIEKGVQLNIGSFSRFERFCYDSAAKSCCIRIKPDIGDGHHARVDTGHKESKFGIQSDLLEKVVKLSSEHGKKITGLHFHIGSGIRKPEKLLQAMDIMMDLSTMFPDLVFLNFGGGFSTPYKPSDSRFDLNAFSKTIGTRLQTDLLSRPEGFTYFFEPGRWLVAESGVLLSEVTSVKQQGSVHFIGTNTGFNHLVRPAMYEAYHHVENISATPDRAAQCYTVTGNICESGDVLAIDRNLPQAVLGDILAFHDAGAYGITMASEYNRRRFPAEVLVNGDDSFKIIRPRETIGESVDTFLLKTGFFN